MGLRAESSVSASVNEMGELEFPGSCHGPVVHRTPEELGIAAVVRIRGSGAGNARLPYVPRPDWNDKPLRKSMRLAKVKRDKPPTALPAARVHAMPAAKPAMEVKLEAKAEICEDKVGTMGRKTSEEKRAEILSFANTVSNCEVARRTGVSEATARLIRHAAGIRSKARRGGGKRTGSAAALERALAKHDAGRAPAAPALSDAPQAAAGAEATVKIELPLREAEALVARFNPAMLFKAGLKAALLLARR